MLYPIPLNAMTFGKRSRRLGGGEKDVDPFGLWGGRLEFGLQAVLGRRKHAESVNSNGEIVLVFPFGQLWCVRISVV